MLEAPEITSKKKIAILGGGMASLTTAFELTNQANWQEKYDITIYQLGWRLGGKGSSGRNLDAQDRIEEHGLHILMGSYENAFQLLRQCYQELNRSPEMPLATLEEAFKVHNFVAITEYFNHQWNTWPFDFANNEYLPGEGTEIPSLWSHICLLIEYILNQVSDSPYLLDYSLADENIDNTDKFPSWLLSVLQELDIKPEANSSSITIADEIDYLFIAHKLVQTMSSLPQMHRAIEYQAVLWLLEKFKNWILQSLEGMIETHAKFRRLFVIVDLACTIIHGTINSGYIFSGLDPADEL